MAEAMAQVRAELGDDAVILSSRRVGGGVEVTAALEPEEPLLILPPTPAASSAALAPPLAPPADLARHNLPESLVTRLLGGELETRLAETIAFDPLPLGERPVLLVGPPGAGKTLSCAKLAARLVLEGKPPLVITTDGQRAGATEQLAAFTRVMNLPLAVAPGPGTLGKALTHAAPGQPVLIDTGGCDPFDPMAAEMLLAFARVAKPVLLLVMPAGLDPAEAGDMARAFAAMGARHLLPTRLDMARRLGGVLAAAHAGGLALTEAGTGADVAQGLTPITPGWLAARLRGGPHLKAQAA